MKSNLTLIKIARQISDHAVDTIVQEGEKQTYHKLQLLKHLVKYNSVKNQHIEAGPSEEELPF